MTLLISATTEGRDLVGAESFVSVVKTATSEGIKEELADERSVIDVVSMRLEEIPQVSVTARDDDGFVELDVVPRETSYVPPGITFIPIHCSILNIFSEMNFCPRAVHKIFRVF